MLTAMTEEDWTIVLRMFAASRSRRGDKEIWMTGRFGSKVVGAVVASNPSISAAFSDWSRWCPDRVCLAFVLCDDPIKTDELCLVVFGMSLLKISAQPQSYWLSMHRRFCYV